MSKPPPTKAKRHFLEVTPHTLHAVRTAGRNVEFAGECSFAEGSRLPSLLQDWSEGETISAFVAGSPQPIWWHLGPPEEAHLLPSSRAVHQFAARFPHGFKAPLEVIGCTADGGLPILPTSAHPWLLGVTPGAALANAAAEVIGRGVTTAALGSATLNHLAAIRTGLAAAGGGTVRLWEPGRRQSHVFTVGIHGVEAVTTCALGFEAILAAVQSEFGAGSPTKAAEFFFGELSAESTREAQLAALLAPVLATTLRAAPPVTGVTAFACSGFTRHQQGFAREMAVALGLPLWEPELNLYLNRLQLRLAVATEAPPSVAMLGALHLAASPHHDGGAWHPTWGDVSRPHFAGWTMPEADRKNIPLTAAPARLPVAVPVPAASTSEATTTAPVALTPSPLTSPALSSSAASTSPRVEGGEPKVDVSVLPTAATPTRPAELNRSPESELRRPGLPTAPGAQMSPLPALRSEKPAVGASPGTTVPASLGERSRAAIPPREPVVIVVRKRGYWLHVGLFVALLGAALAWTFYLDGQANQAAAEQARQAAASAMATAERERIAADEQTRRATAQIEEAEKRARAMAEANTASARQIHQQTEATRQAEIAQARREAEEQTRRRLAAEVAAAAPGGVKLSSRPAGATVRVDDRSYGSAPVAVENLAPGRHVVTLVLPGYVTQTIPLDVTASQVTDLGEIRLVRAKGGAAVESSPAGIDFSIRSVGTSDGASPPRRGRTPARIDDLATGDYVAQFNRPGWPERTERFTVDPDKVTPVATAFRGGSVVIRSEPSGATVRHQGLNLGTTPLTLPDVPPGETVYELVLEEYEPLQLTANVAAGRELALTGTLLGLDRLVAESDLRIPPRPYITTPLDLGRIPRSAPAYIKVSFVVLRDGSLYDIAVLDPIDRKLRERSIAAISKWKYYPGVSRAGYPVNVRISIPVKIARG